MTYEAWRISYQSSEQAARAAYAECARLQAKIEAMEKQEPYSYIYRYADPLDGSPIWRHDSRAWNGQIPGACKPLYALPGAQPSSNLDEHEAYRSWFLAQQGVAYDGTWAFAKAAWLARASLPGAQSGASVPIGWLDEADLRALQQGNSVWLHTEDQGRMIPVYLAAAPEVQP